MSETSILPGAAPVDAGIGATPPNGDGPESAGGDRRRLIMIVGGAVAVLLVVIVAYLLLHKGSSSTPAAGTTGVVPTAGTAADNTTGTKHHTTGTKTLPKVQKNPSVHNPFVPLVQPPVAAGAATKVSTTTVTAASPSPSTTLLGPGATTTPAPVTTAPVSTEPVGIELMSTTPTFAVFHVFYPGHTYKVFKVQAPQPNHERVFDKIFALIGITGDSVTIEEGSGSPFDLETMVSHSA